MESVSPSPETPSPRDETAILYQAGRLLASTLDPETVYDTMRELVAGIVDCNGFLVSSYSSEDGMIRCVYAWVEGSRLNPETLPPVPLAPMGRGMQSEVIRTARPIRVDDVEERTKTMAKLYHVNADGSVAATPSDKTPTTKSTLMVPILLDRQVLGVVQLMSHRKAAYSDDDLRLLEGLTLQMAAAARNAWLYQHAQAEILERKKAEQQLAEAHRRKDEFLAMLAHELRNPLGPIRNAVFLMKQDGGAGDQTALVNMVDRQVNHMSRMIDDLLDMSAITNRKVLLRPERLDIARIVSATYEDFCAGFEAHGIVPALEMPPGSFWLIGDATRLSQVIGNLLNNASKFCDAGDRVTVRVTPDPDGATISITVEDTGIGMDPELLQSVFDTFTQADRSLDRSRGGLGLGLALVKGFVELHDGKVEAQSDGPGLGARFTVRLPLTQEEAPPIRPASTESHKTRRSRRVLVIEDNEDAAESLRMLLDMTGHEVEVAHAGRSGVESARRFRPDVILCDIGLPGGMNGYDVAAVVRSDPNLKSTGLIALTGYGQQDDQRRAREAGFDRHLVKPVDPIVLTRVLDFV